MPLMSPSDIRYSQDSISNYFSDRPDAVKKQIGHTLDDICEIRCSIEDIPPISVCQPSFIARWLGIWISADNRRLWVFKHLERLGKCDKIVVKEARGIPAWKLVGITGSKTVHVRGDPGGYWHTADEGLILRVKRFIDLCVIALGIVITLLKCSPAFGLLYICLPTYLLFLGLLLICILWFAVYQL